MKFDSIYFIFFYYLTKFIKNKESKFKQYSSSLSSVNKNLKSLKITLYSFIQKEYFHNP